MQLLINYCPETDQKSKQRDDRKRTETTLNVGEKNPQHFERYLEFFAEFQNFFYIPRFLVEHLTMFCGKLMFRRTQDGKHSFRHCISDFGKL